MSEPFEESRRLTGCNLYFAGSGPALETAHGLAIDDAALERWRSNVAALRETLGWPDGAIYVRRHRSGVSLAFEAPFDQLYTAVEANEWAWVDAVGLRAEAPGATETVHAASLPRAAALEHLQALAVAEAKPALVALQQQADAHGLPCLIDDDDVSIGMGERGMTWPVADLPELDQVPWSELGSIPTALVTGSNGKTTSVRLLAAILRAHGLHTAHSCTEGVYFDNGLLEGGDYSGPGGARTALRQPQVQAAVLETARGGMLRRGLALCRADAAIVTNISVDHFGEYGIHDLEDLAEVKLTVARAVGDGLLVLNADDALLLKLSQRYTGQRLGWFALDDAHPVLVAHREQGGATCGVADGQMQLHVDGAAHALGAIIDMPLALAGAATYNISNLAGAALAAHALGVPVATIASVMQRFGAARDDNPGRLQRWQFGNLQVIVDYAHNPDGLRGLLEAVGAGRRSGRLAIVLGHAGNREEDALRDVAAVAASYAPDLVLLKDVEGYLRGREAGEVARIMRDELLQRGLSEDTAQISLDEVTATWQALAWVRDGDLLVLPTFDRDARERMEQVFEQMQQSGWLPGQPLSEPPLRSEQDGEESSGGISA